MDTSVKRSSLVALDDDSEALRTIQTAMSPFYNVLTTSEPRRALGWVQNDPSVSVIAVEQILSSGQGLDVLEQVQQLRPEIRRILITEFNDLASIMDGLHNGTIQKMISKPLIRIELMAALSLTAAQNGNQRAAG
jgi:DNA-binding NtrC family response regulator